MPLPANPHRNTSYLPTIHGQFHATCPDDILMRISVQVEVCKLDNLNLSIILFLFQLNFAVGIINFLYFSLRALATDNILKFMWEMETIVDMLTLPPLFMSIWLERTWLGLRFFRFLIWFNFPDILVYLRVLSNSSSIRLAQVVFL